MPSNKTNAIMLEIRGHARGGQGMVTAFEILANIFSGLGDFQVQAFPAFGVERTGAPIQAFLRVAASPILNRSNIYHPHLVVVFDESLLEQAPVFAGLAEGGVVLLNTERPAAAFPEVHATVYTVPATSISLALGLGSSALPIVNAAMIGALLRLFGIELEPALAVLREHVPAKAEANAEAARWAYGSMPEQANDFLAGRLKANDDEQAAVTAPSEPAEPQGLGFPFWSTPLSQSKTGNWRMRTPVYVDRQPPCTAGCPAGTDVRAFVRLAAEGRFQEARALIETHNPFPAVCGRVCPHFCEGQCNRLALDESLNIGAVERFLGDLPAEAPAPAPLRYAERIAVIGSGPAGLTAALRLRRRGYSVTVYEAMAQAGGMMRSGIPRFRLPDAVLDREIARIEAQGVTILRRRKVRVDQLAGDYDAVIVATGSHAGKETGMENEELLLDGLDFLRRFKLAGNCSGLRPGDHLAVIGGGNTAIDVARTALRLGAIPTIYYRRTRAEMPAIAQEVDEALREGIRIEYLTAPVAVEPQPGGYIELTLQRMELGAPDDSGRRRPIPLPGSERAIVVDMAISAIGQQAGRYALSRQPVKLHQGRLAVDGGQAVFAAGDMAWGGSVSEAVGSGNAVAGEVHAFLQDLPCEGVAVPARRVQPVDLNFDYYASGARKQGSAHIPAAGHPDFSEVTEGLTAEALRQETARCLHCGDCFDCGNCYNFCPDAAITLDEQGAPQIDYDYCKGCGICVAECPCSAIVFAPMQEASLT